MQLVILTNCIFPEPLKTFTVSRQETGVIRTDLNNTEKECAVIESDAFFFPQR